MKVKIETITIREVDIPDESFVAYKDRHPKFDLTDEAYNEYMGENSSLLEENESCIVEMLTLDNKIIAIY